MACASIVKAPAQERRPAVTAAAGSETRAERVGVGYQTADAPALRRANAKPAVKTSAEWCDYFRANAERPLDVPWHEGAGVTPAEQAEIADSLRSWQLGETSDGLHLLAAARDYAAKVQDPSFVDTVRLFIAEEQRHGAMLGQFLDLAGVTRAKADWDDALFRAARYSLTSMEAWVTPVVMVETLAMIYYNAIRQATGSAVLRRICERILRDEVAHIHFQCERLAILHRRRPRWLLAATMGLHRVMFGGIALMVWLGHRRALTAGGYNFSRYWRAAWSKMSHAWRLMAPDAYRWDGPTVHV